MVGTEKKLLSLMQYYSVAKENVDGIQVVTFSINFATYTHKYTWVEVKEAPTQ